MVFWPTMACIAAPQHDSGEFARHLQVLARSRGAWAKTNPPPFTATNVFVERLVMPGFTITNSVFGIGPDQKVNIMGGQAVDPSAKFEGQIKPAFGIFFDWS
jgi:hypothetical protein